jgi:hypothetical protein
MIKLTPELLQKELSSCTYAEQVVISSVIGNFLAVGSNWVILPEVTDNIANLVKPLEDSKKCKLWNLAFGAVLEVNPAWLVSKILFVGKEDLSRVKKRTKENMSAIQEYFTQEEGIPDEGYLVLWSTLDTDKVEISPDNELPSFNVSLEQVRSNIENLGYELADFEQVGIIGDAQGVLCVYWKKDKEYPSLSEDDEKEMLEKVKGVVTSDGLEDLEL